MTNPTTPSPEGLERLIQQFAARVDLNTYGEIPVMGQHEKHPDILWLKDKLNSFISDLLLEEKRKGIEQAMQYVAEHHPEILAKMTSSITPHPHAN